MSEQWRQIPETDIYSDALTEINNLLTDANLTEAGEEPEDIVERVRWLIGLWEESR